MFQLHILLTITTNESVPTGQASFRKSVFAKSNSTKKDSRSTQTREKALGLEQFTQRGLNKSLGLVSSIQTSSLVGRSRRSLSAARFLTNMTSSRKGTCTRNVLHGLVAGNCPLVFADLITSLSTPVNFRNCVRKLKYNAQSFAFLDSVGRWTMQQES